jgi:hypothetical protein
VPECGIVEIKYFWEVDVRALVRMRTAGVRITFSLGNILSSCTSAMQLAVINVKTEKDVLCYGHQQVLSCFTDI